MEMPPFGLVAGCAVDGLTGALLPGTSPANIVSTVKNGPGLGNYTVNLGQGIGAGNALPVLTLANAGTGTGRVGFISPTAWNVLTFDNAGAPVDSDFVFGLLRLSLS